MRYAAEFRRAWNDASGAAMDAGKKLLGYLLNQKRLSGVESLSMREVLPDGTIVELHRFYPPREKITHTLASCKTNTNHDSESSIS